MSRKLREGLAALLSLTILLCPGCGDQKTDDGASAAAAAVAAAKERLGSAESCRVVVESRLQYTITREADSAEDTLDVRQRMDLTVFSAPEKRVKRVQNTRMETGSGESHETEYTIYMVKEADGYWNYGASGESWYKSPVKEDASADIDLSGLVDLFSAGEGGYLLSGEETVEGIESARYEGTIGGENLVSCLDVLGLLEPISNMSDSQQERIRTALEGLGGIPLRIWLAKEDGRPVRYETQVTRETVEELREKVEETLGGYQMEAWDSVLGGSVSLTVSELDCAQEIQLPPEAQGAELVDGSSLTQGEDGEETASPAPSQTGGSDENAPARPGEMPRPDAEITLPVESPEKK